MACLQTCRSLLARDAPASSLASSSSPVFSSPLPTYPCLSCSRAPAVKLTTCALSDNDKQDSSAGMSSIRRGLLVGVVATGAALAVFSNSSMAALGPGNDGNLRTAQKADELLKAADKLNIEDAPERYGPGRPGPVQDPTKISQIAGSGSGAIAEQNATSGGGDLQPANKFNIISEAQGKTEQLGNAARDAVGQAQSKSGDLGSAARNALGQAQNKPGELGNAARNAVGQAQSKSGQLGATARDAVGQADKKGFIGNDLGKAEGGLFKPFQQGLKNLRNSTERTGADARNTVADVVSKNRP